MRAEVEDWGPAQAGTSWLGSARRGFWGQEEPTSGPCGIAKVRSEQYCNNYGAWI